MAKTYRVSYQIDMVVDMTVKDEDLPICELEDRAEEAARKDAGKHAGNVHSVEVSKDPSRNPS